MIQIKLAILHIFDFAHDHLGLSESILPEEELRQLIFARKQIEKLVESPALKTGEFLNDSHRKSDFEKYSNGEMNLLELSQTVCKEWYNYIKKSDKIDPSSVLCLDVFDNQKHLVVFMKYKTKNGYEYTTKSVNGKTYEGIVENMTLLPNSVQAVEDCFIVDLETLKIRYKDTIRIVDGEECSIISDRLLFCSSALSQKEIMSTIQKQTKEICESYEIDPLKNIAKTKAYVQEKLAEDGYLRLGELADDLFQENKAMQQEYIQNLIDNHVPSDTFMNVNYAANATKMQKMKTDSGIEISIPSIYFDDPTHFEIVENEDGTLTVELKNILYIK